MVNARGKMHPVNEGKIRVKKTFFRGDKVTENTLSKSREKFETIRINTISSSPSFTGTILIGPGSSSQ